MLAWWRESVPFLDLAFVSPARPGWWRGWWRHYRKEWELSALRSAWRVASRAFWWAHDRIAPEWWQGALWKLYFWRQDR